MKKVYLLLAAFFLSTGLHNAVLAAAQLPVESEEKFDVPGIVPASSRPRKLIRYAAIIIKEEEEFKSGPFLRRRFQSLKTQGSKALIDYGFAFFMHKILGTGFGITDLERDSLITILSEIYEKDDFAPAIGILYEIYVQNCLIFIHESQNMHEASFKALMIVLNYVLVNAQRHPVVGLVAPAFYVTVLQQWKRDVILDSLRPGHNVKLQVRATSEFDSLVEEFDSLSLEVDESPMGPGDFLAPERERARERSYSEMSIPDVTESAQSSAQVTPTQSPDSSPDAHPAQSPYEVSRAKIIAHSRVPIPINSPRYGWKESEQHVEPVQSKRSPFMRFLTNTFSCHKE